jgi:antitoxin MazE
MRKRIVRLGRASGLTIPKPLADQAGLSRDVEVGIEEGAIVLRRPGKPREGWEESFRLMRQRGDDQLLDGDLPSLSSWDDDEWQW